MTRNIQIFILVLAIGILGTVGWRSGNTDLTAAERRSLRLTTTFMLAAAAGVLPGLLFPSVTWLQMTGSIASILLIGTAVVQMRRPL